MKQVVTIEVEFEKNYEVAENQKRIITREMMLEAWSTTIVECLHARIKACKTNLYDNRNRVTNVYETGICYTSKSGRECTYYPQSIERMEEIIEEFANFDYKRLTPAGALQILKALYWVNDKKRYILYDGVSFDDLYSSLLEYICTSKDSLSL